MKVSSKIWLTALSLLGLGCSDEASCMYGTPIGSFEIKGKVTAEDGGDVSGATMRVTMPDYPSGVISISNTTTDSQGEYKLTESALRQQLKVVCIPATDELEPDSTIVNMEYKNDKKKSDSWYRGHAEATVDFTLKKKDNN